MVNVYLSWDLMAFLLWHINTFLVWDLSVGLVTLLPRNLMTLGHRNDPGNLNWDLGTGLLVDSVALWLIGVRYWGTFLE